MSSRHLLTAAAFLLVAAPAVAQDEAYIVTPLEARGTLAPVPRVGEGAPYYSSEQLQAERRQANRNIGCLMNASRPRSFGGVPSFSMMSRRTSTLSAQSKEAQIAQQARKADKATLAAEDARRRAAEGNAGEAELIRTELDRQAAVRRLDWLLNRDFGLGYDPVVEPDPPVAIDIASALIREMNGKEMLVVSGEVRNITSGRTYIPVVTLAVYDVSGNLMMATAAQPSSLALGRDESKPFTLAVPAWKDAARVEVRPGQLAPFMGERDFCRPRSGMRAMRAYEDFRQTQDELRFNVPPGGAPRR